MHRLPDSAVDKLITGSVLNLNQHRGPAADVAGLTYGGGGRLVYSVSWGIAAHVSTQWPSAMLGEVTSVCLDCVLGKALLKSTKITATAATSDDKYLAMMSTAQ
jgi:hypothetical protein